MTKEVPSLENKELAASFSNVTRSLTNVASTVPSSFTSKFSISPLCGPSGWSMPCFLLSGLKCPSADSNHGASQIPFSWI